MTLTTEIAKIQLNGGECVGVFDFYVRATYAQFLAGSPSRTINEMILKNCAWHPKEWWQDEYAALVIKPSDKRLQTQLPALCMMALLDCSSPLRPDYDGSMLRVVWFSDTLPNNLPDFFQKNLEHLDWQKNARDYNF